MEPIQLPKGYQVAGIHCGIKQDPDKQDLTLITSDTPATAVGVYTQNLVCGAPVTYNRGLTPGRGFRAVLINSGIANACTGGKGLLDAREMAKLATEAVTVDEGETPKALVMSTGLIGEFLPMDKIEQGVSQVADQLGDTEAHIVSAARGMMTTDTVHKVAHRKVKLSSSEVTIFGMAKGAAMIGPNMATMLGVVLTDAAIPIEVMPEMLKVAIDESFNCISVEGHTSTSDSVLFLANGQASDDEAHVTDVVEDFLTFQTALDDLCIELARSIPADGEGATHLVTIELEDIANRETGLEIAKAVANSALVKTAVAGADPNWGRIVSAAGYSGVNFDPLGVSLWVNDILLYENGNPVEFDEAAASASIRDNRDTYIRLRFKEGTDSLTFWTTDLTSEYVRLNADYHT